MLMSGMLAWKNALRRLHPGKHRALFEAASSGNIDLALLWLQAGADPNVGFEVVRPGSIRLRQSSLLVAIERQNPFMVQCLLDHGADPQPAGSGMELPLSQWLLSIARSPNPSNKQKQVGLALFLAGANLDHALSPTRSSTLRGVLEGLGCMDLVHSIELQAAAQEVAQSLHLSTPSISSRRRPRF